MISQLDDDTIDDWLSLGTVAATRADVKTAMQSDPNVQRYLFSAAGQYQGRFAVELDGDDMVIWWPTLRDDVAPCARPSIFSEIATFVVGLAGRTNTMLIECLLLDGAPYPEAWPIALQTAGFQRIARKTGWSTALPLADLPAFYAGSIECRTAKEEEQALIARIYQASLAGTLDGSLQLGSNAPICVGGRTFIARIANEDVGLLISAPEKPDCAWIKFVGIVPRCRNLGISKTMILHAGNTLGASGVTKFKSLISDQNRPSIAAHQALGFSRTLVSGELYCWSRSALDRF